MARHATTIHLTDEETHLLSEVALRHGIMHTRGQGRLLGLGNMSELVRRVAHGQLGLYDPATQVVITREEYVGLIGQAEPPGIGTH